MNENQQNTPIKNYKRNKSPINQQIIPNNQQINQNNQQIIPKNNTKNKDSINQQIIPKNDSISNNTRSKSRSKSPMNQQIIPNNSSASKKIKVKKKNPVNEILEDANENQQNTPAKINKKGLKLKEENIITNEEKKNIADDIKLEYRDKLVSLQKNGLFETNELLKRKDIDGKTIDQIKENIKKI